MLGRDCRFLQGEGTNPETRATLREAIDDERPASVDILNYRCNGQQFWNRLTVAPISDADGEVTHYVGFQTDITDRKIRERRLEVMNRVLDHNLRNKMNLLAGYADLLRSDLDDPDALKSVEVIAETTDDLMRIATAARKIDHTLSAPSPAATSAGLRGGISQLASRMRDRYPAATITLSLPEDDSLDTTVVGLPTAIEEGVENAIKHNDSPNPAVDVRVERRSPEWLAVEITDNGPGIPDHETRVLDRGETPLTHADRLGIWLIYWVVSKAGGEFSVDTSAEGTTLRLVVPANP
ncbi:PAS domain-containing protein [Halorubrum lacusprofundi]|uniref:Histidine kinase n=1 Tax=Halorubrum lacusprofundi (strain ATCC 49239 / DSM 5036 / JCM 8891 / ACAM 34) TaxID=416348 RepID=B9LPK0_HALLT|nr:PAS domain-containing protein [Halorubrum lacusprofundi]ACM57288.1 histidine kinase [Halorubrum lacusprofundi ATCC 49239]